MSTSRDERGASVPEFVLVLLVLIPLVFGVAQVALVLHVRNTLTAAAADGARAGAVLDADPGTAEHRARQIVSTTLAERFAESVDARLTAVDGVRVVQVRAVGEVPALGLWGPAVRVDVVGHAVVQEAP